jgi:predicted molibdopterin-dependent oxidoreductase YjgC
VKLRERLRAVTETSATDAPRVHILASAHASNEELFLLRGLSESVGAQAAGAPGISISWRYSNKPQPPDTKFPVPPIDAPNLYGAGELGLIPASAKPDVPDVSALRRAVEGGAVAALYVFDPGPDTLGDVEWIIAARRNGKLPLLVVQGPLLTTLAEAADFVLAGAAWLEKDGTFTNEKGRVQAASRVVAPPGDAMEDWQIFVNLSVLLGRPMTYASSAHVRADLAAAMAGNDTYAGLTQLDFGRPVPARTWLQASNPSERWKWDFLFQDLPPVKFAGTPEPTSRPGIIPLEKVEG